MLGLMRSTTLLLCAAALAGCGALKWGDDGSHDYSRSVALPPLQTGPGMVAPSTRDDSFQVPGEGGLKLNPQIKVQTPKLPDGARLRIEKQGKLYWMASNHKPSMLWPHLKNFWRVNDYSLTDIDQRNGILTTHWTDSRRAEYPDVQHEYRLRIIPYKQGSRTYITVRTRRIADGSMQLLASSTKLELEMLSKLQTYLAGL